MPEITVNGEERTIPEGQTIERLVNDIRVPHPAYAVEVNRTLIPRREHATTVLSPGDSVEIVTLVGGG